MVSYHFPPVHPTQEGLWEPFAAKVAEVTEGRVIATLFPGGSLGKATEEYDMLLSGACDVALIVPTYYAGRFPLEDIFQLPFSIPPGTDNPQGKIIRDYVYEEYLAPLQFSDVKILWTGRFEPNVLHMAEKPVRTVDDLKGLILGFPGGSIPPMFIQAMGASPERVTAPDLYTAMERGMIDGDIMPLEVELGFNIIELTRYITMLNLGSGSYFVGMRAETWNAISPEDQAAIDELSIWATEANAGALHGMTMATIGACEGAGIEFIEFSEEDMAYLLELSKDVDAAWIADVEGKGLPAQACYDDIHKMLADM
jgi:TRAP-type C4-dicarboxylate transport system substrate-binding protein